MGYNAGLYVDGQVTAAEANQSGDDYTKYVYLVNNVVHTTIQQFDMQLSGTLMTKRTGMLSCKPGETNPLKVLTSKFLENGWVRLVKKRHLEAFCTGIVLVPDIEIKLRITFNSLEFFCFGTRMIDKYLTVGPNYIQAKFYFVG